MANENLIECRSCGIMNPRTVAHCPECGAPSLEEERRVLLERKQLLLERKRLLEMQEEALPCRECQVPVAPATTKCPQCGAQKPTLSRQRYQVSELTKSVAIVVAVLAAIAVMGYLRDMI